MLYQVGRHYVGEYGTTVKLSTCLNLTTATTTRIYVQRPDLTTVYWTATVVNDCDGNPTVLQYIIKSGDLSQIGIYSIQAYVVFPSPNVWVGWGQTTTFTVYALSN